MSDVKIEYGTSSALTITLASLASSSTLVAGRESTAIDNTTNKYLDYLLSGKITVGTSPTTAKEIRVYVAALMEDSTWPDVFDGTDSDETITNAQIRDSACKLAAVIGTVATSDVSYPFAPVSVSSLFGGSLPKKFVVFVTHNTGVNLNATGGNHAIYVTPVYETVV